MSPTPYFDGFLDIPIVISNWFLDALRRDHHRDYFCCLCILLNVDRNRMYARLSQIFVNFFRNAKVVIILQAGTSFVVNQYGALLSRHIEF
ncbi:hypothetical protein WK72_21660 [Burkholderia ubonensis]|nr:hypothetical protein WJ31_22175 [Burkholderia ubonensis]KVU63696.1 hypothetical protein WK72_21660 [Burkholderia ubonensis]